MSSVLKTYTKKELQKKLKTQKLMVIFKVIIIILMVIFSVIYTIDNDISFYTFLPLFFIPMAAFMVIELNKIKKELNSRK